MWAAAESFVALSGEKPGLFGGAADAEAEADDVPTPSRGSGMTRNLPKSSGKKSAARHLNLDDDDERDRDGLEMTPIVSSESKSVSASMAVAGGNGSRSQSRQKKNFMSTEEEMEPLSPGAGDAMVAGGAGFGGSVAKPSSSYSYQSSSNKKSYIQSTLEKLSGQKYFGTPDSIDENVRAGAHPPTDPKDYSEAQKQLAAKGMLYSSGADEARMEKFAAQREEEATMSEESESDGGFWTPEKKFGGLSRGLLLIMFLGFATFYIVVFALVWRGVMRYGIDATA